MNVQEYLQARGYQTRINGTDLNTQFSVKEFMETVHRTNYVKNFTWMGQPILQLPTDLMAMQEIIWKVKPDYIIETGVAFGGMLLFYASMLESIGKGKAVGIDIDPRDENMRVLEKHPLRNRISIVKGSSIDKNIIEAIKDFCHPISLNHKTIIENGREETCVYTRVPIILVSLDSNHTHDHVLQELRLYSPLVSVGSYIVVMDTSLETLDEKYIGDRPWGPGNSPGSAVKQFLNEDDRFKADTDIENRILLTSAPGGWLRRVK